MCTAHTTPVHCLHMARRARPLHCVCTTLVTVVSQQQRTAVGIIETLGLVRSEERATGTKARGASTSCFDRAAPVLLLVAAGVTCDQRCWWDAQRAVHIALPPTRPHRIPHPYTQGTTYTVGYLVDPARIICSSQGLSHASVRTLA